MQAAKYFTFIFFGLSCFVIMLFGGFVVCHCYRRLRRRRQGDDDLPVSHPEQRLALLSCSLNSQDSKSCNACWRASATGLRTSEDL